MGVYHWADETREIADVKKKNGDSNAQAQIFGNPISPYDQFVDAESIILRRSGTEKEWKEQRGSRSISEESLYKSTKAIRLFAMKISSFLSAILNAANQCLRIATQCFAAQISWHNEFPSRSADDSLNRMNPIDFSSSMNDNAACNLIQMKH